MGASLIPNNKIKKVRFAQRPAHKSIHPSHESIQRTTSVLFSAVSFKCLCVFRKKKRNNKGVEKRCSNNQPVHPLSFACRIKGEINAVWIGEMLDYARELKTEK